jgi:ribosomal protein L7Ae-like RNA K-turn-binding protein
MENIISKMSKCVGKEKDQSHIKKGVKEFLKHYRMNIIKFSFDQKFLGEK